MCCGKYSTVSVCGCVCMVVCVCGECGMRYMCVRCGKYSEVCVCVVVCVTHRQQHPLREAEG